MVKILQGSDHAVR